MLKQWKYSVCLSHGYIKTFKAQSGMMTPLILVLGSRGRWAASLRPAGLHTKFQASQGHTVRPFLKIN